MFLGTLYTVITIPLITIRPPKYDWIAIVSLNKINARIKIDGVYMVETNADMLEPILFKDSKNNASAIVMPKNPLIISIINSSEENFGRGMEKTIIVMKMKMNAFSLDYMLSLLVILLMMELVLFGGAQTLMQIIIMKKLLNVKMEL